MNNKKRMIDRKNRFNGFAVIGALIAFLLPWSTGCLGARGNGGGIPSIQVTYCGNNWFECDKDKVPLDHLSVWLEKQGAGPSTAVNISMPPGAPAGSFKAITQELKRNGFQKIMFTRPRQVDASVNKAPSSPKKASPKASARNTP